MGDPVVMTVGSDARLDSLEGPPFTGGACSAVTLPAEGSGEPCEKHGNRHYCGLCAADAAPKCEKHGRPWYCGECGAAEAPHG